MKKASETAAPVLVPMAIHKEEVLRPARISITA